MAEYQVEIRLAGYAREHIRRLIYAATRRFNIKGVERDYLPSIRLYGPSKALRDAEVIKAVEDAASGFGLVSYRIKGFSHFDAGKNWFFDDMRGICLDIEPSESLKMMREDLCERLDRVCESRDERGGFRFEAMVELGELDERFESILAYFKADEEGQMSQRLLRLTVLRNGQPICEYDLARKRTIYRGGQRESRTIGEAIDRIRQSGGEALQPIWDSAHRLSGKRLSGRQLTLVEDNPAKRIPRVFLIGEKGRLRGDRRAKMRQATLVEDNPSLRIPKIFITGLENVKRSHRRDRTRQEKLIPDERDNLSGFLKPLFRLPRRLRHGG